MIESGHRTGTAGADPEGHGGLRINVRLLASVHGALFVELLGVSRGFRTARAIHLMTIGQTHERASVGGAPAGATTPNTAAHGTRPTGSPPSEDENRLFVSKVLESFTEGD
jgi:hypothetical protein